MFRQGVIISSRASARRPSRRKNKGISSSSKNPLGLVLTFSPLALVYYRPILCTRTTLCHAPSRNTLSHAFSFFPSFRPETSWKLSHSTYLSICLFCLLSQPLRRRKSHPSPRCFPREEIIRSRRLSLLRKHFILAFGVRRNSFPLESCFNRSQDNRWTLLSLPNPHCPPKRLYSAYRVAEKRWEINDGWR